MATEIRQKRNYSERSNRLREAGFRRSSLEDVTEENGRVNVFPVQSSVAA